MTLLDVGSGWSSTMLRALDEYHVNVIGLMLSHVSSTMWYRCSNSRATPAVGPKCDCRVGKM